MKGRSLADVDRFVEVRPRWPLGKRDDQCAQQKGKQPSAKRVREEQETRQGEAKLKKLRELETVSTDIVPSIKNADQQQPNA